MDPGFVGSKAYTTWGLSLRKRIQNYKYKTRSRTLEGALLNERPWSLSFITVTRNLPQVVIETERTLVSCLCPGFWIDGLQGRISSLLYIIICIYPCFLTVHNAIMGRGSPLHQPSAHLRCRVVFLTDTSPKLVCSGCPLWCQLLKVNDMSQISLVSPKKSVKLLERMTTNSITRNKNDSTMESGETFESVSLQANQRLSALFKYL